jgi:hypothetical protein
MRQKPYIVEHVVLKDLERRAAEFAGLYREYGVVIFPKLLLQEEQFHHYLDALRFLFRRILSRSDFPARQPADIGDLLVTLDRVKPLDGKIITDLGTQPNKFFALNRIKFSSYVEALLNAIFEPDSLKATPPAGDTLHFFGPREAYLPYNLPIHQDFQYLMQSQEQVTFYVGLSDYRPGSGGLEFWERSQKLGVLPSSRNSRGHYEVVGHEKLLASHESVSYSWNAGDFAFFDSLLCHRSVPNVSTDGGRVVQLFRFSNIRHAASEAYDWASTVYPRRSVEFANVFPELDPSATFAK